jgi:drug/metabolite transporter (DMT)-like permease
MSQTKSPFPPVLGLLGGILAVSTASLFIRYAQQDAPSLVIAAARMGIAALLLTPYALMRRRAELSRLKRPQLLAMGLAGFLLALHFASWITSLEYTTVASSVVLVTTTPLWVALLSPLVLKERLAVGVRIGLLVAMAGGVIVGLSEACQIGSGGITCSSLQEAFAGRALIGNGLALLGAWCASGYLLVGRRLRSSLTLASYTFLVYLVSAVVLLAAVFLSGNRFSGYQPETYGWFLALAIIPQLVGHTIFNWALRYLSAAYVSVALLGEPVGSVILALLFLREAPAGLELVGAALIMGGIYLASRPEPAGRLRKTRVKDQDISVVNSRID